MESFINRYRTLTQITIVIKSISFDKIYGEDIIRGKESDTQASPCYGPTIFPKVYQKVNESRVVARYTYTPNKTKNHKSCRYHSYRSLGYHNK